MIEKLREATSSMSLLSSADSESISEDPDPIRDQTDPLAMPVLHGQPDDENAGDSIPDKPRSSEIPDSKLPDIPLPKAAADSIPVTSALKTLLVNKKFQRASAAVLTAMCVVMGLYATNSHQPAFDLRDQFNGIKHSDTVDGYIIQAHLLDAKGYHAALIDGWQKAFECAKSQHYSPLNLARLYIKAGDKLMHADDRDAFGYSSYLPQSPSDREVAISYYQSAITILQKEKLPKLELMARYRIASLERSLQDIDKQQNLRAILELEKDSEASDRLVQVNYELGAQCELEGNYDDAAKYLIYAVKYDTNFNVNEQRLDLVCTVLRSQKKYGELIRLLKHLEHRRLSQELSVNPRIYFLQQLRTTYELTNDTDSVIEVNKAIKSVNARYGD